MPVKSWRERYAAETERQRQLRDDLAVSVRRRADALADGAAELGSKSAVAKELGIDVRAVRRAINEYRGDSTAP